MADPSKVAALLLARAETLSVGSPALPKAMPDVAFTPPANGQYLRVSLFTNAPAWEGLSSGRMDQGLLQITVVWPKNRGVIKPREAAQAVMAHFPKGLILMGGGVRVKINRQPWAASPILEDTETLTPVTVSWVAS